MFKDVAIAIVFDLRHNLEKYKKELIDFAVGLGLNSRIFVSDIKNEEFPKSQGESVYMISSYKHSINFKVDEALKQSLHILGNQSLENKTLILITDSYKKEDHYKYQKSSLINKTKDYGCKIIYTGNCDKMSFEDIIVDNRNLSEILNEIKS